MNTHRCHQPGFTLIELLIALALFGIMSVLAWRGLDTVLQSRAAVEASGRAAVALASAWTQVEADLLAARAATRSGAATPPTPHIRANAQRLELLRAPAQCAGCWQGVVYDITRHDGSSVLRRRTTAIYTEAGAARTALTQLAAQTDGNGADLPAGAMEHIMLRSALAMRLGVWQESAGAATGLGTWLPLGAAMDYLFAAAPRAQGKSALKVEWQLGAPWDGWVSKVVVLENRW
jgi:prepilin-type N-terminal cleavage/methylation domain-containing protein